MQTRTPAILAVVVLCGTVHAGESEASGSERAVEAAPATSEDAGASDLTKLSLENLRLNAGVRDDYYDTFHNTVNPRAGLIYSPVGGTTLKLLYGRAFRAPNAFELNYDDGGSASKSNPDLDPETINTYELVLEQVLIKDLRLVASGFHYDIDNLIVQTIDPGDGLIVYQNVEEVTSSGLEVELQGKLPEGLTGRISYAFQRTKDKQTDELLTNSPEHMAKLSLIVPLHEDELFAGVELQYLSSRKTLAERHTQDVLLANLTVFSQKLMEGLEVSASVYNLFNWKYGDPGSAEHRQDIIEQDGISFRIKLTYSF